jgi:hypothetical protein
VARLTEIPGPWRSVDSQSSHAPPIRFASAAFMVPMYCRVGDALGPPGGSRKAFRRRRLRAANTEVVNDKNGMSLRTLILKYW